MKYKVLMGAEGGKDRGEDGQKKCELRKYSTKCKAKGYFDSISNRDNEGLLVLVASLLGHRSSWQSVESLCEEIMMEQPFARKHTKEEETGQSVVRLTDEERNPKGTDHSPKGSWRIRLLASFGGAILRGDEEEEHQE